MAEGASNTFLVLVTIAKQTLSTLVSTVVVEQEFDASGNILDALGS